MKVKSLIRIDVAAVSTILTICVIFLTLLFRILNIGKN